MFKQYFSKMNKNMSCLELLILNLHVIKAVCYNVLFFICKNYGKGDTTKKYEK